jgi:hypothetical protein
VAIEVWVKAVLLRKPLLRLALPGQLEISKNYLSRMGFYLATVEWKPFGFITHPIRQRINKSKYKNKHH